MLFLTGHCYGGTKQTQLADEAGVASGPQPFRTNLPALRFTIELTA